MKEEEGVYILDVDGVVSVTVRPCWAKILEGLLRFRATLATRRGQRVGRGWTSGLGRYGKSRCAEMKCFKDQWNGDWRGTVNEVGAEVL